MLFSLDLTLVIFVASFLLFMMALNAILLKPVGAAIAKRKALVDGNLEAGKHAHQEANKLLSEYEDHLKKIRTDAQATIAKATEEANLNRHNQLEQVAQLGLKKFEKAKSEVAAERESLIDALVAEERELVETITRKVLGDDSVQVSIDASQVRRTLEEAC